MLPDAVAGHEIGSEIERVLPGVIAGAQVTVDGPVFEIPKEQILSVCRLLKEMLGFERIAAVTGVDWWPREPRFEVIYLLHGIRINKRLRLTVRVSDGEEIE